MLNFYFVRHGNKENIPFDPPLTKKGVKQAEITALYLKNNKFLAIFSSPKLRTQQTAQILTKYHALEINYDDRLIERLEWEVNVQFLEFVNVWRKTDLNRSYQPAVGDSSVNKGKKMKEVLAECITKYNGGDILIVTHGGAIGDLLRNLFNENDLKYDIDPITNAPHIHISECSITKINYEKGKFTLVELNKTTHLPAKFVSKDKI